MVALGIILPCLLILLGFGGVLFPFIGPDAWEPAREFSDAIAPSLAHDLLWVGLIALWILAIESTGNGRTALNSQCPSDPTTLSWARRLTFWAILLARPNTSVIYPRIPLWGSALRPATASLTAVSTPADLAGADPLLI